MNLDFLFIRKYKNNREIAIHSHEVYEFVYYFDGKGSSVCGDKTYHFDKNSYVIIPPRVEHDEKHIGTGYVIAFGFTIDDESIALNSQMYNGFNPHIYALIDKIRTEFNKKAEFFEEMIKILLHELVLNLKRSQLSNQPQKSTKQNGINFAISYMNEYFMTDIDFEELAQSVGYCKDHFRILFKKKAGLLPKKFILNKRLSYARKLLAYEDIPLTQVATNCGYEYYSVFCAFFKKEMGMTPLLYRNLVYKSDETVAKK